MRNINKVAVLGSGVMGSRIACHFANVGVEVLLLDIPPRELTPKEEAKGMQLSHPSVKNRIVNDSLKFALKSNPSPIYRKSFASRITTGNFDDDLAKIADCDWTIEVIVERLDIKQQMFERVEKYRKPGTLITSNTSGIPIHMLIEGRSEDFRKHFCGSHFFNPPRYLKLLEIIPTPATDPAITSFLMEYGETFLGKTTVLCKDTPAFIANRVGVFSIQALFHTVADMGLTVEQVDKLTGPVMGRPKSATFRTCDVVGLDTLVHVANGVRDNCPDDEQRSLFEIPSYVTKMVENGWLGSKTKQGFYKKVKDEKGKSTILSLDLNSLEYTPQVKAKFATLEMAKPIEDIAKRTKALFNGQDQAGEFYKRSFSGVFAYVSNRIPEITDALYKIDDAMRAGFGWELGPFETWDAVGIEAALKDMNSRGLVVSPWINQMIEKGITSFYKTEDGLKYYYDLESGYYALIPGQESKIALANLPESAVVWKNSGTTVYDLGDGILNIAFHTKMNTIGGEVLAGLNKALDLAEASYKGLVVANEGQNFSAGANVGMIFMMAVEQEYDELDFAIRAFQNTMMRVRYSNVPVVAAPHGLTLGGACELCLHADKVIANAETYMGLVEFGVGLIPGGGGTKEFAVRTSEELKDGDIRINTLRNKFLTVGQAKVSTSAHEAFDLGYLKEGKDEVIVSREQQIAYAKQACLQLANKGYAQPAKRKVTVLGQEGLGIVFVGAHSMMSGDYISEHDKLISEKLGFVLCGGDLSENTEVSEQYLLDLERRAFLELCGERKTLERMQSLLKTGKILRN
ncbi:MAG: 3-hydroxyacyl-CoA dehydrogenase NAD-binding domain-containing protein [Flavobacteriales bacterium]|nr:3-hydroxyacyl-CoA dehydrogenase NAD-binding domain-containing protein [Flavobacteriales bacterium]MDG1779417.1 3-hydroxyacyl-CoA dehydrogenase NAD-binding domain-containing protein [Flavobacteriales bacterium]MDG2245209.1 3-hydroxyacyl-CoA dehydrogenase NAD-binding domain-containing protein [Flavobacteriales bacterium]